MFNGSPPTPRVPAPPAGGPIGGAVPVSIGSDNAQPVSFAVTAPSVLLPKGGGSVRGIGEKFGTNPVNGTAALTIPIETTPGRGGFGPQLALSYDSGAGNGTFGWGWTLNLPSISRKTDKGLPRYRDEEESDVFLLSGAEDLVPVLRANGSRWTDETTVPGIRIERYRPRIEGLFARIERWTNIDDGAVFWRSITRTNVTTFFGTTEESRIADPLDRTRVFCWLIAESYDHKGNAIRYRYAREDDANVSPGEVCEQHRTRTANRYLKRVQYGNAEPIFPSDSLADDLDTVRWLFEVVFDYDEGHYADLPVPPPTPGVDDRPRVRASAATAHAWTTRPDSFSSYRAAFEVRTHRRCHRVLLFHAMAELTEATDGEPYLVRSIELAYDDLDLADAPSLAEELVHQGSTRFGSFLRRVTRSGYVHDPSQPIVTENGVRSVPYLKKSMPPLELGYGRPAIQDDVREIDRESLEGLPAGLDEMRYSWVDLDGEGVSGILTEQGNGWWYKPNLGNGTLGPPLVQATKPWAAGMSKGQVRLTDLAGDGNLDAVLLAGPILGFAERTADRQWVPFRPFQSLPNVDWDSPNLRLIDLTGDGHADVLMTVDDAFTIYPSHGEQGFGAPERVWQPLDDDLGPRLVLADGTHSIYLADMSGDGLADLVRVSNGEVCYWPSLGYGRFGAKVIMDHAPWLDQPEQFQQRVRLADIDGSGTTDLIYLGRDGVRLYFNQSGNRWSDARPLDRFPAIDELSSVTAIDLLGNGTACLVWSSPLPGDAHRPLRYIDLMGGQKPHLLVSIVNNLGAESEISYAPSTRFYLDDQANGMPWITRVPFPVHCVERVTISDRWRKSRFTTTYSYHHGYFDGVEREFRGFGRVEQVDVESFGTFAQGNAASPYVTADRTLYQPPIKTTIWYHTGALIEEASILAGFQREFFPHWLEKLQPGSAAGLGTFQEHAPPLDDIPETLTAEELREAHRACKGQMLRTEVCELDVDALELGEIRPVRLFAATSASCQVQRVQARASNRHAVFLTSESERITYQYDLDLRLPLAPPDPRIAHTLNLKVDEYGSIQQTVSAVYPRLGQFAEVGLSAGALAHIRRAQAEPHLIYTESRWTNDVDEADAYRLRAPCEIRTYELTGITPASGAAPSPYFSLARLRGFWLSLFYQATGTPVGDLGYHELPNVGVPQKRLVEHVRTLYFDESAPTLTGPASFAVQGRHGLPYEAYRLSLTEDLLSAVLGARLTPDVRATLADPTISGYLSGPALAARFPDLSTAGQHWMRSGTAGFAPDAAAHYYLPERYTDPFGNVTTVQFDPLDLLMVSLTDPMGNTVTVTDVDFRHLAPREIRDANLNLTEARYDEFGLLVATAVKGKGLEGDSLATLNDAHATPPRGELVAFFTGPTYDEARARIWLGDATARHVISFGETHLPDGTVVWGSHPASICTVRRERHTAQLGPGEVSPLQTAFAYSDGLGTTLVRKVQAEPETPGGPLRWVVTGKTIVNNKGNPVKTYEPYFSPPTVGHGYGEPVEQGVATVVYYDALGRTVRTDLPDGSYTRVELSPWQTRTYDSNDTASEPGNAWLARMTAPTATLDEQRTALLAAEHADTPSLSVLDSLGREIAVVAHNRVPDAAGTLTDEKYATLLQLDAEGQTLWVRDGRGNLTAQAIIPPVSAAQAADPLSGYTPCYDIAGGLLYQHSMDGGDHWSLHDADGKPMLSWSVGDRLDPGNTLVAEPRTFFVRRDALRRTIESTVRGIDPLDPTREIVYERTIYGETPLNGLTDALRAQLNLRGQPFKQYDGAGIGTSLGLHPLTGVAEAYDFKGNGLRSTSQLVAEYTGVPDWSQAPPLDPEIFTTAARYDALNRVVQAVAPRSDRPGADVTVTQRRYNEAGLLTGVDAWLRQAAEPTALLDPSAATQHIVTDVDYDARGQRQRIAYGNGTATAYEYSPLTFRLTRLRTLRGGTAIQDLTYTYDAVGNVTRVLDAANETVFHNGDCVSPGATYRYDALYRLTAASGREHQGGDQQVAWDIGARLTPAIPNDCQALRTYVETYEYDAVGNILEMAHHRGANVAAPGLALWRRAYQYAQDSNRLLATSLPGDPTGLPHYAATPGYSARYPHDRHGNMTSMPHLPVLAWSFADRLRMSQQQVIAGGAGERTYYVYDSAGRRVRKVTETAAGARKNERIYLSGTEVYRVYGAAQTVTLERESLHVMDDRARVALIELRTRVVGADPAPETLVRYQLGNHLGSAVLELDALAQVITYEEFHPFGGTAYQAARNGADPPKRYRFAGEECDEETGLSCHGLRSYAAWLGRWTSPDPAGTVDGTDLYVYCRNAPTSYIDPGGTAPTKLSEPSVLDTIDKTIEAKNIAYNTEVTVRVELPDRTIVTRRYDRMYNDPKTKNWVAIEAKGERPNQLTKAEKLADKLVQEQGGRFEVVESAGKPPTSPKVQGIFLEKGFQGEIQPGNLRYAHGSEGYVGGASEPHGLDVGAWREGMNAQYADAKPPTDMARVSKPNQPPEYVTQEQAMAERNSNVGAKKVAAERAANSPQVKPLRPPEAKPPAGVDAETKQAAIVTSENLPKAARIVSQVFTVYGATVEAAKTDQLIAQQGYGSFERATNSAAVLVLGVAAGAVDDAIAVAETSMYGEPVVVTQSWEDHGSGPVQHAVGEAYRGILKWAWRNNL